MVERKRERVLEIGESGGNEVRGGVRVFVEEERLAWREKKPRDVQES